MYDYKFAKKESAVIQRQKREMKTLKPIWLHKRKADNTEDRNLHTTLPAGTIIEIDTNNIWNRNPGEPNLIYAETGYDTGYVKYAHDHITYVDSNDHTHIQEYRAQKVLNNYDEADTWLRHNHNIQLLGRGKLQEKFKHLDLFQEINPELWIHAFELLKTEVFPRVQADLNNIQNAWAYAPSNTTITSFELSSADLHREGRLPVFIKFSTGETIVYKPSSLAIDRLLFGNTGSIASALSTATHRIPTYQITEVSNPQGDYGYMNFLNTQLPVTDADKESVFKSIAENMAMSYFFGFEDIHRENYVLQKDHLHLIDMEVISGVFSPSVLSGWENLLRDLKTKILVYPRKVIIKPAMQLAFNDMYNRALTYKVTNEPNDLRIRIPQIDTLTSTRVRCVPIATQTLSQLLPLMKNYETHSSWRNAVTQNVKVLGDVLQIFGVTSNGYLSMVSLRKLLSTLGTYNALREGNIPVFYRKLDEVNIIYDEQNVAINLNGDGNSSPKINQTAHAVLEDKWRQSDLKSKAVMEQRNREHPQADTPFFDNVALSRQELFDMFWNKVQKVFYP